MIHLNRALAWATDLYAAWFADWLHIHFVIRTAILLLVLWGALFVLAQFIQYVMGPLAVLLYRHIFFRAYNYLFVETPQEFLYIRYYAKDKPTLRGLYLRLTDKVKQNRLLLNHTKYKGIVYRGSVRRVTWVFIATLGVTATLWLTAFGLHQEYYIPALAGYTRNGGEATPHPSPAPEVNGITPPNGSVPNEENADDVNNENNAPSINGQAPTPPDIIYPAGYLDPAVLSAAAVLRLSPYGMDGARLRDVSGFLGVVIGIVWGDAQLEFLGEFIPEVHVPGLYWLQVRTADGLVGYIASHLVEMD
ncbi:MAG: hypothetical protein FWC16_10670 [Defluviitaleaceae bacterium]|nr:hypothetical protein [Defluviitaleaceae bacterium]MCL2275380.1 hypothetical protein [Defluviitaleaceae bacterium]